VEGRAHRSVGGAAAKRTGLAAAGDPREPHLRRPASPARAYAPPAGAEAIRWAAGEHAGLCPATQEGRTQAEGKERRNVRFAWCPRFAAGRKAAL